jgi:aspartokinase/homoserine dehydrogenase 1
LKQIKISLLGSGTIGREFISRIINKPDVKILAIADTTGFISCHNGFSQSELSKIVEYKSSGCKFVDSGWAFNNGAEKILRVTSDVFIDVTAAQTANLIQRALENMHVITSNKVPIADSSYDEYMKLHDTAKENGTSLNIGTTAGAGMQFPNMLKLWPDGVESIVGCLSGTMNYLSQKLNEFTPLSVALKSAMNPPRNYAEPDPRIDLSGKDFARKVVILSRICGHPVELSDVQIRSVYPEELDGIPLESFIEGLSGLDREYRKQVEDAHIKGCALWYLGNIDLVNQEYSLGFKEIAETDPLASARESENSIKIQPKKWRRPATFIGPGAGPPETVSGILSELEMVMRG